MTGNPEQVLDYLSQLLEAIKKAGPGQENNEYRAYLHGQVYGAATVLRIMFPGPGNLGEKAALMLRPVVTEHECRCEY